MPAVNSTLYDAATGGFVCDFIQRLPTTDTGKAFKLYAWQVSAIMDFYSTMDVDEDTREQMRHYWYLYLEVPKKNGKSELAAALGIYHLFADGELNAEVYVCAADKENAGIVFNAAVFMLTTARWTAKMIARGELHIVESRKLIEYRRKVITANGGSKWVVLGIMKVLSSEAYSKHGYKPSCVIFDELHAQPNRDLWDVMTFGSGSGRKQPVYIVLTTAGDDPDRGSIGWEIHEKAVGVRDARQLKKVLAEGGDPRGILSLRHAADEDLAAAEQELLGRDLSNWLPILYGLTAVYGDDPDDLAKLDIWDEALWYQCNPSLGQHLKIRTLRLEAQEAKKSEAGEKLFRWLRLNQWISVKTVGWVPLTIYDKTQWPPKDAETDNALPGPERRRAARELLRGKRCYGGLDLSKRTDLTAFVLLFPPQKGLDTWVTLYWGIWRPEIGTEDAEKRDHVPYRDWARAGFLTLCPGDTIDYDMVEESIFEAAEVFELIMLGADPHLSWTLIPRLQKGQSERGRAGINCIETPQDMKNMSPAMHEMEKEIRDHKMLHEHNTCARWNFGNVRCRTDGNENIKPMKNLSTGRIDVTVAWINSKITAMIDMANAKPYDTENLGEDWGL
ncbi:terminase TerL endonuclease subunit [Oscillibacter sp.]|uniref:terminase large subunit n=1 Tax=Oscillibacter sp. TaxID=1945593 RepID=UPI00289DB273|nr:terminase TerL endonuclease subunit [Oscillibacter sp.]